VSENARLDVNSPGGGDDDLELWDQSGFMLRNDMDDPIAGAKYVPNISKYISNIIAEYNVSHSRFRITILKK
jgi:hypothetical protein